MLCCLVLPHTCTYFCFQAAACVKLWVSGDAQQPLPQEYRDETVLGASRLTVPHGSLPSVMCECMVRHPRGSYGVHTYCCLRKWPQRKKKVIRRCHPYATKYIRSRRQSPPHKRFLVGCSSRFMRLAEYLTALRVWCKQRLPGG